MRCTAAHSNAQVVVARVGLRNGRPGARSHLRIRLVVGKPVRLDVAVISHGGCGTVVECFEGSAIVELDWEKYTKCVSRNPNSQDKKSFPDCTLCASGPHLVDGITCIAAKIREMLVTIRLATAIQSVEVIIVSTRFERLLCVVARLSGLGCNRVPMAEVMQQCKSRQSGAQRIQLLIFSEMLIISRVQVRRREGRNVYACHDWE